MSYISQNIKHLRDSVGMSQTEFGKLFNLTRDKIASYEAKVTPSVETLLAIADYFHKSLDEIVGADLENSGQEINLRPVEERPKGNWGIDYTKQVLKIQMPGTPLVEAEALAGFGNALFNIREQDIQDRYLVPDFNNVDFMIRVKGSSMYPKYNSGDIVACRILRERTFIQWNKAHVLATEEQGILIKRVKKGPDKATISAASDNKDYDSFEIPWTDITGIALVIGVIRLE